MAGGSALSLLTLVAFFCCNRAVHLTDEDDVTDREPAEPHEFCSHETFNASCQPNEVLLIQTAHYGRVRLGRCVKIALGFLGCKKNVRHVLETRCSGRRQCSLPVADVQLRSTTPCPTDVTWHLEVSYACQRVLAPNESLCGAEVVRPPSSQQQQQQQTFLSASSGFVASVVSTETQYGRDRCPWALSVPPGQRVQLRLVVFQSPSTSDPKFSNACVELGAVQDSGRRNPLMLCGWDAMAPNRKLYDSETNHVTLTLSLLGPSDIYVIHYKAIGCPLYPLPSRSWSQRLGDKLIIRCNDTDEKWSLVCRQPIWMGSARNCSSPERIVEWRQETTTPADTQLPMSILLAVTVGVALGIFIGGILLALVGSKINERRKCRHRDALRVRTELMTSEVVKSSSLPLAPPGRLSIDSSAGSKVTAATDSKMRWICPAHQEPEPEPEADSGGGGGGDTPGCGVENNEQPGAKASCGGHRQHSTPPVSYNATGGVIPLPCSSLLDKRQNSHHLYHPHNHPHPHPHNHQQSLSRHHYHRHVYDTTTTT